MKSVYKYYLWGNGNDIEDEVDVKLPANAEILSVGVQGRDLVLWALVDTDQDLPLEQHSFRIAGTGHPIDPTEYRRFEFVGTVFMEGPLVFHVFDTSYWKSWNDNL